MPLISVIIRAYNQAQYLSDAIESILSQSFRDFEIIVIDDGSTDQTSEVLDRYKDKIILYQQENKGRSEAGNVGISLAKGEYLAFLDADDLWYPDFLLHTADFLLKNKLIDVVYTGFDFINSKGKIFNYVNKPLPKDDYLYEFIFGAIFPFNTALSRKKCFNVCGGLDKAIVFGEDWHLWYRFAIAGFRFDCLSEILASYRRHEFNTTTNLEIVKGEIPLTIEKIFKYIEPTSKLFVYKSISYLFHKIYFARYCFEAKKTEEMTNSLIDSTKLFNEIILSENEVCRLINIIPLKLSNLKFVLVFTKNIRPLKKFYLRFYYFKELILQKLINIKDNNKFRTIIFD